MVADRVVGALPLFWSTPQWTQAGGISLSDQLDVVSCSLSAESAASTDDGAYEASGEEMASAAANCAFVSRFQPVRDDPR